MMGAKEKKKELPKAIDSRLSIGEQELLCELARHVSPEHIIVEIANKTSESTEALARGAQSSGGRVFNLTLYGKGDSTNKTTNGDSDAKLHDSIRETESMTSVTILDGSVYDLTRRWKEIVGLLVVIGYQHYEEVREAVVCWQECLPPDVVVVVHNCCEPGPARAVKELIADCGNFVTWRVVDNLTVLVADKCQHYWVINTNEIGSCRHCGRKRNFKRLAREATSLGVKKRTTRRMAI